MRTYRSCWHMRSMRPDGSALATFAPTSTGCDCGVILVRPRNVLLVILSHILCMEDDVERCEPGHLLLVKGSGEDM